MITADLLKRLKYDGSPNFIRADESSTLDTARDFGHIFRRARRDLGLKGVYTLREQTSSGRDTIVPLVYVCESPDEISASNIHRLVWNQNVVPFLIVTSPKTVRVYPSFEFSGESANSELGGAIAIAHDLAEAIRVLDGLGAAQIDNGSVWEKWGKFIRPERRVDWQLLGALSDLDKWLGENGVADVDASHALIGKFVYLHYLRRRGILSDKKLAEWNLVPDQLFSRTAKASAFWTVLDQLDEWLNGSTFPLTRTLRKSITERHIKQVASTFIGDDPATGQLALNFDIYDFSVIPIETLSVIYEQFLHAPRPDQRTPGKSAGAYYTPVPVVNFMLEELDALHQFGPGMRVLDPSCGSGAFLVQSYRRIIERDEEFDPDRPMRPARLRQLLEDHIFGIDRDSDACRVAELSLTLTLLDYVDPPDLRRTPSFRLPTLSDTNIFHGDFFDPEAKWRSQLSGKFDWIVGNPPWIETKGQLDQDHHVVKWMNDSREDCPVGGKQVAEAFAWEVAKHVAEDGHIALLLPAMTLFKDESRRFRQSFFAKMNVVAVANFANLAYVLFPGHRKNGGNKAADSGPERPAAAIFYSPGVTDADPANVTVFSPMVTEQLSSRPGKVGSRSDAWNIVVDAAQITELEQREIANGSALPWKLAMWGSHLDARLLDRLQGKFDSLGEFCSTQGLGVAQGLELRGKSAKERVELLPEIVGKLQVRTSLLRNTGPIFEFPDHSTEVLPESKAYVRVRGGKAGLPVSRPPHVIVDKVRRFAVFSDEFIIVPVRQIGIGGPRSKADLLRALSLYLISDFAIYHQFIHSPEWGVSTSISTLDTLRLLPVALAKLSPPELKEWKSLHGQLVVAERHERKGLFSEAKSPIPRAALLKTLNEKVNKLLGLRSHEIALIEDLVSVRMEMVKGKVSAELVRHPTTEEITVYAEWLKDELDAFIGNEVPQSHEIVVSPGARAATVAVTVRDRPSGRPQIVEHLSNIEGIEKSLSAIQKKHSQWIYFRRDLRVYRGRTVVLLKPLERLHWTRSRAMLDAASIISDTLG